MAAAPLGDDRIDWLEELEDITVTALTPAAAGGVLGVIDSFAAEDGYLPHAAVRVRARLVMLATGQASSRDLQVEERVGLTRGRHRLSVHGATAS